MIELATQFTIKNICLICQIPISAEETNRLKCLSSRSTDCPESRSTDNPVILMDPLCGLAELSHKFNTGKWVIEKGSILYACFQHIQFYFIPKK